MEVDCVFFGPIRETTEEKETTRVLADGATVMDLIEVLAEEYEGLEKQLLTEDGELRGNLNVTVNKRNVRQLDGASTTLSDGDTVHIAPSIQGGARPCHALDR